MLYRQVAAVLSKLLEVSLPPLKLYHQSMSALSLEAEGQSGPRFISGLNPASTCPWFAMATQPGVTNSNNAPGAQPGMWLSEVGQVQAKITSNERVNGKGASGRNTLGSGGLGTHGPSKGYYHTLLLWGMWAQDSQILWFVQKKRKKKGGIYFCVSWFLKVFFFKNCIAVWSQINTPTGHFFWWKRHIRGGVWQCRRCLDQVIKLSFLDCEGGGRGKQFLDLRSINTALYKGDSCVCGQHQRPQEAPVFRMQYLTEVEM